MTEVDRKTGIWFVYDGECPLCTNAALAFRIKDEYGEIHLVNAREASSEEPLMQEIDSRGYDLDEGMVLYDGRAFYHGEEALRLMSRVGKSKGVMNLLNKSLWWSDSLAKFFYPWLRGGRNFLLRRKRVGRIDNLELKKEPTFKPVFGADWDGLPSAIQKHYRNRPYTEDQTRVEGVLDVRCSGPIRFMAPLLWLMGGIPPINEKNVPVTVDFESDLNTKSFHFNRVFHFKDRKPYRFRSRLVPVGGNEVVEVLRSRFGWRANFIWEEGRVKLVHKGFIFSGFGHFIPLPLGLLLGKASGEEIPVDDDSYDMHVDITHPWWGKIYEYKGRFHFKEGA